MVNKEEFSKRLQKIFDYYELSASAFADKIEVGKASISHLLSGRNNPSLDFVLRVVKNFPEVELYWLLNGKGSFPKNNNSKTVSIETESKSTTPTTETVKTPQIKSQEILPEEITSREKINSKDVERIVIFFKNGTFKSYETD